jgi:hypothetical protein
MSEASRLIQITADLRKEASYCLVTVNLTKNATDEFNKAIDDIRLFAQKTAKEYESVLPQLVSSGLTLRFMCRHPFLTIRAKKFLFSTQIEFAKFRKRFRRVVELMADAADSAQIPRESLRTLFIDDDAAQISKDLEQLQSICHILGERNMREAKRLVAVDREIKSLKSDSKQKLITDKRSMKEQLSEIQQSIITAIENSAEALGSQEAVAAATNLYECDSRFRGEMATLKRLGFIEKTDSGYIVPKKS